MSELQRRARPTLTVLWAFPIVLSNLVTSKLMQHGLSFVQSVGCGAAVALVWVCGIKWVELKRTSWVFTTDTVPLWQQGVAILLFVAINVIGVILIRV